MPAPISREDLLAELRRLGADGDPPRERDMQQDGAYTPDPYRREFGSWLAALEAAGYDPAADGRVGELSRADVLDRLRQAAAELGHPPSTYEAQQEVECLSKSIVYKHFDSWDDALAAAGLDGGRPTHCQECEAEFDSARGWSIHRSKVHGEGAPDVGLLEAIRQLADGDSPPAQTEMAEWGPYSTDVFQNVYGSWPAAVEAAGFDPDPRSRYLVDREALIEELQRLGEELDRIPRRSDMREHGRHTAKPYRREFGSWFAALEAADFDPDNRDLNLLGRSELIVELQRLADELGYSPRVPDMREHGRYGSKPYRREFGSWIDAQEAAGLAPTRSKPGEGEPSHPAGGWATARREALVRDGGRCQDCGMPDHEYRKEHGRSLDVHHKKPYREFEDPANAHDLSNLVTLCRACHADRHAVE